MNCEPPIDDSYLREDEEDMYDEMLRVRDDLLEALSPLQKSALFNDFADFCEFYKEEIANKYFEQLN